MKDITNEKKEFLLDLGIWLKSYVEEVGEVVLKHVDELFKDKTIVYLARTYAEDKKRKDHDDETALYDAYVFEVKYSKGYILNNVDNALYLLCYKRYDEKKENE